MNRNLARNFLNKELADLAKLRKEKVMPEQGAVRMNDIRKVKVRKINKHAPSR